MLLRVRLVFLLFSLGSLGLLAGVVAVSSTAPALRAAAGLALLALAARWLLEMRRGESRMLDDVVDGALLVCAGAAARSPLTILLLLYARVSLRSMVAAPRAAVAMVCNVGTFAAVVALSGPAAGGPGYLVYVFLGSGFPLASAVMHLLDQTLRRLRRAGARERALRDATAALAAAVGRDALYGAAVAGLRRLVPDADASQAQLLLRSAAGDGDDAPAVVAALPGDAADPRLPLTRMELTAGDRRLGVAQVAAAGLTDADRIALVTFAEHVAVALHAADLRDVVHRRSMEEGLRRSEANFRHLFDSNPQPMWVVDVETHGFLAVNDAAVAHYGYSRDEFLAMTHDDICTSGDAVRTQARQQGESALIERSQGWRHQVKDGRTIEVEITSHSLDFSGRPAAFVQVRDVTDERRLAARLHHQAYHDALTGLPNRQQLEDRATEALRAWRLRAVRPPAMLVIDLDGFKAVNDSVGHAAGDEVLSTVGERLLACVRPGDTPARLGGDEFAVLLDEVGDADEAVAVARRVVETLEQPFPLGRRTVQISASVGIAVSSERSTGVAALLSDADLAMYVAKAQGRASHAVFSTEHRTAVTDRLHLQEDLARAVAAGDIAVAYQPQLDLASGRVTAVEALARWTHATRGPVSPEVFIPLAEQNGLVAEIDAFVLRTACEAVQRWAAEGASPLRVAVNISGHDLDRDDLVPMVQGVLDATRLEPWRLELELTEGVALSSPEKAVQRIQELRALGVRVAIDDYGVGYSMLARLRDMPIDRLKIDRSFVRDLCDDDDAAAIVGSTVSMAHALGLTLTAEGVESADVLDRLATMGCDSAQGYHICRPLAEAELLRWVRGPQWRGPQAGSSGAPDPAAMLHAV
jgi:diguanylate cyclase (GGDEF)-like protein/PAS domain S-box-containing protein